MSKRKGRHLKKSWVDDANRKLRKLSKAEKKERKARRDERAEHRLETNVSGMSSEKRRKVIKRFSNSVRTDGLVNTPKEIMELESDPLPSLEDQ